MTIEEFKTEAGELYQQSTLFLREFKQSPANIPAMGEYLTLFGEAFKNIFSKMNEMASEVSSAGGNSAKMDAIFHQYKDKFLEEFKI